MLYAAIAIIAAGVVAALAPLAREWYEQKERRRREEDGRGKKGRPRRP